MAKPRIPLPKQVEKIFRDESQYDRKRDQQVSLDEVTNPALGQRAGMKHLTAMVEHKGVKYTCEMIQYTPKSDWYFESVTPEIVDDDELYGEVTGRANALAKRGNTQQGVLSI
jgi:hypothetical protein